MNKKSAEKTQMGVFSSLGRTLAYVLKNYKWACLIVVICIFISAITTLISTLFTQSLIDDYIAPLLEQTIPDYAPLASTLVKLGIVLAFGVFCAWAWNRIMVTVTQGTMRHLRDDLFTHMESLPIRYFDTNTHGNIMSVYTNDVDTLRQLISQSAPQLVNSLISLISTLVSMIVLSIPLTLISLAMTCIMVIFTVKLGSLSARYFIEQQKDLGVVDGYIEEMMEGQKVVKVFCHEDKTLEQFRVLNDKLRESSRKANVVANITMPINANIGNISYVLVAVVGAALVLGLGGGAGLTLGTVVTFLGLSKSFTQPVSQISQQVNAIVMAAAGAKRAFALMDQEPETDGGTAELVNAAFADDGSITETEEKTGMWAWKQPAQAGGVSYTQLEGDVTFRDVDFSYNPDRQILHDITMFARPGQKIAFVGSTGAGKTTITNLINRFYDIQDGTITYDGIPISDIKKPDLRHSLGIVLQDTHLFTGTVMDNIRYGRLDATDEECIAAAQLANADSFIHHLPDGYQTMLTGDGASLSQGQRQLLAIARAAVADPPVLILDEATSSIDTRTEVLVQQGMDALMTGRTSFVIAHRLSTVQNADCIMVMEQGRIIERGTHDELLARKGQYYHLYTGLPAEA